MKSINLITIMIVLLTIGFIPLIQAQTSTDETTIKHIIQEEITTWNIGDGAAYSKHFAENGTFTNILGLFFTGREAFIQRHIDIFTGIFKGTTLQQNIVSLRFVRPDVAIVETLCWVSGFSSAGPSPGTNLDAKGRLRTRLLQVMVKNNNNWEIESYHNTDVKPAIPTPEPK